MKRVRRDGKKDKEPPHPKVAKLDEPSKAEECFFDRLPDHLAVKIFRNLKFEEHAFLLPQVCKKWALLAESNDLWKDICLSYCYYTSEKEKRLFFKCMKMAPLIHSLTVELDYRDGLEFAEKLNVSSPLVIKELTFIYDNMPPEALFTLLRLHKNHLKKLCICDTYTPYIDSDVKRIWRDIQNLTELKELVIDGSALLNYKAFLRKTSPCWKTLEVLNVRECAYEDMTTVQKLISVNPKWTEVYLAVPDPKLYRPEVKALAKCLNLKTVEVPFCKEISYLKQCSKLDCIIINWVSENSKETENVISTFSQSSTFPQLKMVKVVSASSSSVNLLVTLIKRRPKVNLLTFVSCHLSGDEIKEILDCAPGLEKTYFFEMSGECIVAALDSFSDSLAPELKTLSVVECVCEEENGICVESAISKLQKKRPELKILSRSLFCKCKASTSQERGKEGQWKPRKLNRSPEKVEKETDKPGSPEKEEEEVEKETDKPGSPEKEEEEVEKETDLNDKIDETTKEKSHKNTQQKKQPQRKKVNSKKNQGKKKNP